jgi:hypothetical protein
MGMVSAQKTTPRHTAPCWKIFWGAKVLGGQLEDIAWVEFSHALPEQDDNFSTAHVAGVPLIRGEGKITLVDTVPVRKES